LIALGGLRGTRLPEGNFWRADALIRMTYENRTTPPRSREERAALMEKRREDAEKALDERKKADDAFRANYERLKAERLAREAAGDS
jgi:hypothetical protein